MHAVERRIAAIAGRQDNVITREQLLSAGLGRGAIGHRLEAGLLQRLHRQVYLLGAAPPTFNGRVRAAVLACGAASLVSNRSAAAMWRLSDDERDTVDVTVVGRNPGRKPGIKVHRTSSLHRRDVRRRSGIPLTSPARTLLDLAATETQRVLERALNEARVLKLVNDRELQAAIDRAPARKGSQALRALLDHGPTITRSEAERRLLKLIRDANLPQPLTNVRLHGYMVDFLWPQNRMVVEFDGFAFHGHRQAFERDRKRDRTLVAAGYRVIRITWRQLTDEPLAVLASVAQALTAAA
jgi:very-short-patch-repair endonuclease